MPFAATVLSAAVGDKSGGRAAPNRPEDVRRIQALLRKVLGTAAPVFVDGVCDASLKAAISDFQKLWGAAPDATVDPAGQTLKRLDRLANPLEITTLEPARLLTRHDDKGRMTNDGGDYRIACRTCDNGPLPPASSGYSLHLCLTSGPNRSIDVTGRPLNDLLDLARFASLMTVLDALGQWASLIEARVQLRRQNNVISTSMPKLMTSPVQPHNGRLVPLDESAANGPRLTYQGDPETKDFHGRMLAKIDGYDKFIFIYGGVPETRQQFRGFDCITYAGTACGASTSRMAESADLAASLGCTACVLNKTVKDPKTGATSQKSVTLNEADPADVKAFFAEPSTAGCFLMWSGGHIVLVVDGTVHEFHAGGELPGYDATAVADWLAPYKTKRLTVRRLPGPPARQG